MKSLSRDLIFVVMIVLTLGMVSLSLYFSIYLCWDSLQPELDSAPLNSLAAIISFPAAIIAIVAGFYAFRYWMKRPKFIIGLINPRETNVYFKKVSYDEVHFKADKLAPRFNDDFDDSKLNNKLIKFMPFKMQIENDGFGKIYVVVQNIGRRMAEKYSIDITLDGNIDIIDVESENLLLDGFYTPHIDRINNPTILKIMPGKSIIELYNGIYKQAELNQAYVRFTDSLESFGYETICLSVLVDKACNEFRIFYRCDCPDIFPERQLYVQKIVIDKLEFIN